MLIINKKIFAHVSSAKKIKKIFKVKREKECDTFFFIFESCDTFDWTVQ